jgi:hypothetical protein
MRTSLKHELTFSQELRKEMSMVDTLWAVMMMLYTHPLADVVEAHRLMRKGYRDRADPLGT